LKNYCPQEIKEFYDVAIIGAGVSGGATAYSIFSFTNARRMALFETYARPGLVNSNKVNNAESRHRGAVETNHDLAHARMLRVYAQILDRFLETHAPDVYQDMQQMVLGVGELEVASLRRRFAEFKPDYPEIELLERDEIGRREPSVVEGRDPNEKIVAICDTKGRAVDYGALAEVYIQKTAEVAKRFGKEFHTYFDTTILKLEPDGDGYLLHTNRGLYRAGMIFCCAGPYSLLFAHSLGVGEEYALLPIQGGFYLTRKPSVINGKVYRVQKPGIPVAQIHMDRAVYDSREVRMGPTAMVVPLLEARHWSTFFHFVKTKMLGPRGLTAFARTLLNRNMFLFAMRNCGYEIPYFGKWLFLKAAQKIVPMLAYKDIWYARGVGGIRPQLVNLKTRRLEMGTGKILGPNSVFDITPSPGASSSLGNGLLNASLIPEFSKGRFGFNEIKLKEEFGVTLESLRTKKTNRA